MDLGTHFKLTPIRLTNGSIIKVPDMIDAMVASNLTSELQVELILRVYRAYAKATRAEEEQRIASYLLELSRDGDVCW